MSISTQLTVAAVIAAGGLFVGWVVWGSISLFGHLGEPGYAAWRLMVRVCRLATGIGVALAIVVAGRWAIRRWFGPAAGELDVVLVALAVMVVFEAGGFIVPIRATDRVRVEVIPERSRPTGAVPLPVEPREQPMLEPEGVAHGSATGERLFVEEDE
jgi:hypothetical protein